MGEITREQFLRGVAAINRYQKMTGALNQAMKAGGCDTIAHAHAGDDLLAELSRHISERCNDPPQGFSGTWLDYMLYDCGGPVRELDGTERMVNTPELLWTYWEETESGPFSPHNLSRRNGDTP